mmetsp:Transcript_23429/g.56067  ORF Transcript_23429/g.56067 Transcript_23429/m.56067 type:complete len:880 (+) Transcript_23429:143-2782(+)
MAETLRYTTELAEETRLQFTDFLENFDLDGNTADQSLEVTPSGSAAGESRRGLHIRSMEMMLKADESHLEVDFEQIKQYKPDLAENISRNFYRFEVHLRKAVQNLVRKYFPDYVEDDDGREREFWVALYNNTHFEQLRILGANHLGKLVSFSGTVTRTSEVRPELYLAVFRCQECNTLVRNVEQQFRFTTPCICTNPTCGNRDHWTLVREESTFVDWQRVRVQESSDEVPAGSLPRTMDVILRNHAVEQARAGDKMVFNGCLIVVPDVSAISAPGERVVMQNKGPTNGDNAVRGLKSLGVREMTYKLCYLASSTQRVDLQTGLVNIRGDEEETPDGVLDAMAPSAQQDILQMKRNRSLYQDLVSSLAPGVFGAQDVKKAMLLMLMGGVHKRTREGIGLRGDINIAIVGDPASGKSQLLKYIAKFLPRAVYTSGKASSAAGLTATVVKEPDTNDYCIEAGALMLADNGICCIDEFDKMSDLDRVAIHEVMEQQTVTIAKAGLHTTLNARCSVVAAANPLYGSYEASLNKAKNINLPDSLLSRFDLIFIMLDELSNDGAISEHVLSQHRFRARGDTVGVQEEDIDALLGIDADEEEQEDGGSQVYVKYNRLLHGPRRRRGDVREQLPLSKPFMRKYIHYAKERIRPELTASASDEIAAYYTSLRQFQACPKVTVRMLETVIRLSTAHAKLRLSNLVEASDVEAIKHILDTVTGFQSINPAPDENIAEALPASAKAKKSVRKTERRRSSKGAKRTREAAGRSGGGDEDDEASASDRDDDDEDAALADAAEGESGSEDERDEPARGSGQYPMRQLVQVLQAQFVLYQPRAARGEAIELDAVLTDLAERHGMPGVPRSLLVRAIDEGVPDVMVDEEANAVYFTS